jgi:uncharacterized protein (DUF433 family)
MSGTITADPDILGGVQVFAGTRVPVTTLFDYLRKGHALEDFFDDFPTVSPAHVDALLREVSGTFSRRNAYPA